MRKLTVLCALVVLFNITNSSAQDLETILNAAEKGNAEAQFKLGIMYGNGQGVSQNDTQAIDWYRKAAEQGYAPAQFNLGYAYENGQGVSEDKTQAIIWYRKAADKGYAPAQFRIGIVYEYGQGVSRDKTQAIIWYRKAAEQSDEAAKNRLAELSVSVDPEVKRDPNDVVAKVLNYSSFGNDDGSEDRYWYQDKSDKCRYKAFRRFSKEPPELFDLNALDPKYITFQQSYNGRTIIRHDTDVLFQTSGQLNLERLQRGWTLIYSKYCKGKQKAF